MSQATMTPARATEIVRAVIREVFSDRIVGVDLEQAVQTQPQRWSPGALVEVYCESGVPSWAGYNRDDDERWWQVLDKLTEQGLYCEPYNAAVVCVYES